MEIYEVGLMDTYYIGVWESYTYAEQYYDRIGLITEYPGLSTLVVL